MIWYFLAGFISGAVGVVVYAHLWMQKHATVIRMEDILNNSNDTEEQSDDRDGIQPGGRDPQE